MLHVYAETDRQLGRVLTALDDQNGSLILFALHGMEANRAQDHFLGELLTRLNNLYLGRDVARSRKPSALNAMAFLRRALPPTLQYRAASLLGEGIQDWVVNRALVAGRDWSMTPSFPILSGGEGLIRLNLKGREPSGYFEPGSSALADYVGWLQDRLAAVKVAETGEPLIEKIIDVDNALPGARREFLPDLILQWAPDAPVGRIRSPDVGEIEMTLATGRGGNHNDCAFLVASGDGELLDACSAVSDIAQIGDAAAEYLIGRSGQLGSTTLM
jgi:hypothetical protein